MTFKLAKAPESVEELGSVQAAIATLVESIEKPTLERVEVKGFTKGWFSSKFTLQILYGTGVVKEATVVGDTLSIPAVIYNAASSVAQDSFMKSIPRMEGGARRRRTRRSRKAHRKTHTRRRRC